jgi:hypothetical protein
MISLIMEEKLEVIQDFIKLDIKNRCYNTEDHSHRDWEDRAIRKGLVRVLS